MKAFPLFQHSHKNSKSTPRVIAVKPEQAASKPTTPSWPREYSWRTTILGTAYRQSRSGLEHSGSGIIITNSIISNTNSTRVRLNIVPKVARIFMQELYTSISRLSILVVMKLLETCLVRVGETRAAAFLRIKEEG
jgi:hypothetical protein